MLYLVSGGNAAKGRQAWTSRAISRGWSRTGVTTKTGRSGCRITASGRPPRGTTLREAATADGNVANIDFEAIEKARVAAVEAEKALDGEVTPENDYIAEGLIDPDGVSDDAGRKVWSQSRQGWDCIEGESVYVAVTDRGMRIVHNWWRSAYRQRHDRDLWRVVDCVADANDIAQILDHAPDRVVVALAADLVRENPDLAREVREQCKKPSRARRALDAVLPPAEAAESAP